MSTQGISIIGAGFPRSGTLSVKLALETLFPGSKCHHMIESITNKQHPYWGALARNGWAAEKDRILKILSDYQFTVDAPSMLWWKDIKQEFPQAKIILTVRDNFDAWYTSITDTIYQLYTKVHPLPWWGKPFFPQLVGMKQNLDAFFGPGGLFDGRFEDKEFARKVYEDFIEDVKRSVPPDQLLVFNVKEGWAPLCKFLGVPCPDQPFPNLNETESMKQRIQGWKVMKEKKLNMIKAVAVSVVSTAIATVVAVVAVQRRK